MSGSSSLFSNIWKCLFSPRLYRIYNSGSSGGAYVPNSCEKWGNTIIQASLVLWQVSLYAFPIIVYSGYKRGYFTGEGRIFLLKLGAIGALTLFVAVVLRALGRATNSSYLRFNDKYRSIIANYSPLTKKELQNYEFDYSFWPVDFSLKNNEKYKSKTAASCGGCPFTKSVTSPISLLGYIAIHSFGIKLIYPGSITTLNYLIKNNLDVGRKKLIEDRNSERFKLETPDSNELDVMFVDQRGKTSNGSTLVICTEGNAGFYEIGIMVTPMDLGYSVLGWNHPGFGCSTGTPYIDAEKCAIDTVVQFSLQKLNFIPESIILFGWSIGGFASSFAATNYPDVKAVILDATFDEILPLAVKQMPKFLEPVVNVTIRDHANLDVAHYLSQYCGPVLLIRRSEDEIISLTEGDITTNRGNHLLLKIFRVRYPYLLTNETEAALWAWFAVSSQKKDLIYEKYNVSLEACKMEYEAYKSKNRRQYPTSFGENFSTTQKIQMLLYLANIYMNDFPSTHCTSLPSTMFHSFAQI